MAKKEHMTGKTDAELTKLGAETRRELYEARFARAGARAADASAARKLRKTLARVLTEERSRALGGPAA